MAFGAAAVEEMHSFKHGATADYCEDDSHRKEYRKPNAELRDHRNQRSDQQCHAKYNQEDTRKEGKNEGVHRRTLWRGRSGVGENLRLVVHAIIVLRRG